MAITPSIGRVVWYYPPGHLPHEQPFAAIVAHVWGDTRVNLAVFTAGGLPMSIPPTSVLLVQPGAEVPAGGDYCTWMPYQIWTEKQRTDEAREKEKLSAISRRPVEEGSPLPADG